MSDETISQQQALQIVDAFVREITAVENHQILGVYLIGSLGGGYYRPGHSDIDTFVLLGKDSPYDQASIEEIANQYYQQYHIPKGFGAVSATIDDCFSPHGKSKAEEFSFCMEIARLKTQGKLVYGEFHLEEIPMPAREDFIQDEIIDQRWFHAEYGYPMFDQLSVPACINVILSSMRFFLIVERKIFEFNKFNTVNVFRAHHPPQDDPEVFAFINHYLQNEEKADQEIHAMLRAFGIALRDYNNEKLLHLHFTPE